MNSCPVRLRGPEHTVDPAGNTETMRADHGPVVPVLMDADVPGWLVIGYRELHQVLNTPATFARSSARWNAWDRVPADWPLLPMVMQVPSVLYSEGDEHRRRSRAITDALAAVDPHELRSITVRMADRLIDTFCGTSGVDLRTAYAARIPALVLGWIYGLEDRRGDELAAIMTAMIDGGPDAMAAQRELMARMAQLITERRAAPGPDAVSRLLAHPAGYTDDELVGELIVVLGGGNQPTGEWIGNALRLMLTDERFSASFAGARSSVRSALNEVLWEDTPTQIQAGRFAVHDTELGGRHIRQGDMVLLGLSGANRDPSVRAGVPAEGNNAHLSFSHGAHQCPLPAQDIAETIAATAVEILLDRLPDIELAVAPQELRWRSSPWVRGVSSLPVTFTPVSPRGDR